MSAFWPTTGGESGILRKHDQKEKLEELLVFGYACKLFRDDEKAREIDQGKHLIPWMGENSLKIDRYDCRGALSDLLLYEASKEGYDAMRWLGLSESERHLEQLCDEERYQSLHTNQEEDELYKEEELKRSKNHGQVQYSYDVQQEPEERTIIQEEEDEPFSAPTELDIPVNMTIPSFVKQNARIEKTALFISKEGPQMEILLKTKQANNLQFAFMYQDDPLYRYYRHVLMAIKTGRYNVKTENSKTDEEEKKREDGHYLHPSLAPLSDTGLESAIQIPTVFYKPSANCAYSQLVNKIQGTQPIQEPVNPTPELNSNGVHPMFNQQAYIQHYQQYGYYPTYDPNNPYYANYTAAQYEQYKQYYAKNSVSNPYAQIVSNVKAKEVDNSKVEENGDVYSNANTEITKAPVLYKQGETVSDEVEKPVKKIRKPHLFSLAQYSGSDTGSDEDSDSQTDAQAVVIPPADMQLIVDKMASYVAKNGSDFEIIVKSKGDPRFLFLDSSHVFHPYYKYKLKEFWGSTKIVEKIELEVKKEEVKVEVEEVKQEDKVEKKSVKIKDKKIITPVCFSIKKPKESDSVSRDKSALPVEDSTDDEEQTKEEQTTNKQAAMSQNEVSVQKTEEPKVEQKQENAENNSAASQIIEIEDPVMELIDLTDEMEDKRDAKRAEDRVRDKIVAAAREKIAAKNKALQLERKKRAAAFLSQLKPTGNVKNEPDEIKTVRASTPEEGEINDEENDTAPLEDYSRLVYHIESSPKPEKNHRSRSPRHKSSHHKRKSHKRSHSHSKKKKREKRSSDRKKSKRKRQSRSRSRSRSKHCKVDAELMTVKDKSEVKSNSSSGDSDNGCVR